MSYRVAIHRSIQQVDADAWEQVAPARDDLLMDPRFLLAVERAMGPGTAGALQSGCAAQFWYLLVYDADRPVAAACVSEYPMDTALFAHRFFHRFVELIRLVFPRYLKFRVTFCGLPVSTAGSNLRIAEGAEGADVLRRLNEAVEQIARERRTWVVVYKEMTEQEAERLRGLDAADYLFAESLPMNRVSNRFGGFDGMLAAMRSHYRYKITKSRKKFARGGLRLERRTFASAEAAGRVYTPAMHALYETVTRRAEHRLEILPREFFLQLCGAFPDDAILTTIADGERVVAFAWSLRHGSIYRNLFVGIDYEANEQADAYFNLMTEDIAHGMEQPVEEIFVGQTADEFKSRLGCTAERRFLAIKLLPAWLRWCFRRAHAWVLPPPPPPPERDLFKDAP